MVVARNDEARARDSGPAIGRQLAGRWRLTRVLGVGGQAAVYEAVHRNGRRVAIKLLHAELASSAEARRRFVLEAYATNRVSHEGVVSIYDDAELDDGTPFLVMELLEGETLAARMKRCAFSSAEALWVADRMLDVLICAHAAGVVHCDLKPANVLVTERAQLKLLDFGHAGVRGLDARAPLGTPGFMAPEQAAERGSELDERTDVWGVGATVLALLSGQAAHPAPSPAAAIEAARRSEPPSIRARVPQLDGRCADLLERALAVEPSARWPSARAMRDALHEVRSMHAVLPPRAFHGSASFETLAAESRSAVSCQAGGALRSGASRSGAAARSGS